ncbi:MAG: hypothetical protein ABR543_12435 [Gemmatimonadaceae bacterium]
MQDALPRPSREVSNRIEIPARPVREIAREALDDIDSSLERLIAWDVDVPPSSRLHQARDILAAAADTGVLVPKHRGDLLGLRALELSFDYGAIADALPKQRVAALGREIRDSLNGALDPPETARGPLQLQSQAVVCAAFVRGGLSPIHPTHSPKHGKSSPDLVLENGSERYAIEAKRPQARKNIFPRFQDAHAQLLNYGLRGGVLIDVTDCLRDTPGDHLDREVRVIALELYDRVFVSGQGYRPGYSDLLVVGAYTRVAWNSEDRHNEAMVKVHTSSAIDVFATTENNLNHHRAKWIRSRFQAGLERLSLTLEERSRGDAA